MTVSFESQVSSKGQVVIPKILRDRLGITGGTVVTFAEDVHGLRLQIQSKATRDDIMASLAAGVGLAGYRGPALSPAQIRQRLRDAFAAGKA